METDAEVTRDDGVGMREDSTQGGGPGGGAMGEASTMRTNADQAKGDEGHGRAARPRRRRARRKVHPAEEVRELFEEEVRQAKEQIVCLLKSGSESSKLAAANAILDRVFGRPRQAAEPPEEKHTLPPIRYYEVDTVGRTDGEEAEGHD